MESDSDESDVCGLCADDFAGVDMGSSDDEPSAPTSQCAPRIKAPQIEAVGKQLKLATPGVKVVSLAYLITSGVCEITFQFVGCSDVQVKTTNRRERVSAGPAPTISQKQQKTKPKDERHLTPNGAQFDDCRKLPYSADSVEFCPLAPCHRLLACGTYQLQKSTGERVGSINTYTVDKISDKHACDKPQIASSQAPSIFTSYVPALENKHILTDLQHVELSAGLLDMKWSHQPMVRVSTV